MSYAQNIETINYASGDIYVGELRNGELNGQGTYTNANGDVYVGEFRDDQRNGQGAYTFADGRVDNGIWNNGEFVSADNIATRCFESDFQDCE